MESAQYDIVQDAIVVTRWDGTEEIHRCRDTNSDKKRAEVFDRLKREETGWYDRWPCLLRIV